MASQCTSRHQHKNRPLLVNCHYHVEVVIFHALSQLHSSYWTACSWHLSRPAASVLGMNRQPCTARWSFSWSFQKSVKLSSVPSISLRGGDDYSPLIGGREELSMGKREGKNAKRSCHSSDSHSPSRGVWKTCQTQPLPSKSLQALFPLIFLICDSRFPKRGLGRTEANSAYCHLIFKM